MCRITVVLPFEDIVKSWPVWAENEKSVDFKHDSDAACRCTASYAVMELKSHFGKIISNLEFSVSCSRPKDGCFIKLEIIEPEDMLGAFRLIPKADGLIICGTGRNGLLNGVYELLRWQGCRWLEPGERGDVLPPARDTLKLPEKEIIKTPSFKFRSLDLFGDASRESRPFLVWMARNGLNCCHAWSQSFGKLAGKLGITIRAGGHIIQRMLKPERILPSGRTVWEEHPEWYGVPAVSRGEAGKRPGGTQCCLSQPSLFDFITDELLEELSNEWTEADIVDVWGFDSRAAGGCNCPGCSNIGNTSDQTLFFISELRKRFDQAFSEGRLDRKVKLTITAYEGNNTLEPPSRPLPKNLADSGDICIFYPIARCYKHNFSDAGCDDNRPYAKAFSGWLENIENSGLSFWAGEYYHAAKSEDLPLLFTSRLSSDIPFYHASGAEGTTYMHTPIANWGVRALTQLLYARLAWDVETDVNAFLTEYFENRYNAYAEKMSQVYRDVEKAWEYIFQWRNWFGYNVLRNLLAWDGARPQEKMKLRHFKSPEEAIASGWKSVELLSGSLSAVAQMLKEERSNSALNTRALGQIPETPDEEAKMKAFDIYEHRLGEDMRGLVYGTDMMKMHTLLLEYHLMLFKNDKKDAVAAWAKIEALEEKMDSYYFPMGYETPGPGVKCLDALTRSQLKPVIARCRKNMQGAN